MIKNSIRHWKRCSKSKQRIVTPSFMRPVQPLTIDSRNSSSRSSKAIVILQPITINTFGGSKVLLSFFLFYITGVDILKFIFIVF